MFIYQDRTCSEKNQIISLKDLTNILYHKITKKSISKKHISRNSDTTLRIILKTGMQNGVLYI